MISLKTFIMSKVAVILAGGLGTRLKPYTVTIPKPLVPIHDKPVLEHLILALKKHGFSKYIITLNHMSSFIRAYFGDGSELGVVIEYSEEKKRLSTIGPLSMIEGLPDNFLIINSDVLTDLDFSAMWEDHIQKDNIFTVGTYSVEVKSEFGELVTNETNSIVEFREKPIMRRLVSMGVYMAKKEVLRYVPSDTFYGFDHLMLDLIDSKDFASTYNHEGYWLDIGRPSDYERAENYIAKI